MSIMIVDFYRLFINVYSAFTPPVIAMKLCGLMQLF